MATVSERLPGATDPPPHVDLAAAATRAEWLAGVCEQAADIIAAALDATAPPARRLLGRKAAREQINAAASTLAVRFAAVGLDLTTPPSALRLRREHAAEHREATTAERREDEVEDACEMAQLGAAVRDVIRARDIGAEADTVQAMPIAGVLFLALMGTPDEQAGTVGPLVLALRTIRATVEGWANMRSMHPVLASVPFADLDLLVRRIDATIEIARRGGVGGAL